MHGLKTHHSFSIEHSAWHWEWPASEARTPATERGDERRSASARRRGCTDQEDILSTKYKYALISWASSSTSLEFREPRTKGKPEFLLHNYSIWRCVFTLREWEGGGHHCTIISAQRKGPGMHCLVDLSNLRVFVFTIWMTGPCVCRMKLNYFGCCGRFGLVQLTLYLR